MQTGQYLHLVGTTDNKNDNRTNSYDKVLVNLFLYKYNLYQTKFKVNM